MSGQTLTGGTYFVDAGSTIQLPPDTYIKTLAADLTLSGAGSVLESLDDQSNPNAQVPIEDTLETIAPGGALRVLGGRDYTTANPITDNGLLQLGGGSFQAASLSIGSGGSLTGFGTVDISAGNSGTVDAVGGELILGGKLSGAGTYEAAAGATLDLTGGGALPATIIGGGELLLDSGTYTDTLAGLAGIDSVIVDPGAVLELAGGGTLPANIGGSGIVQLESGTYTDNDAAPAGFTSVTVEAGAELKLSVNALVSGFAGTMLAGEGAGSTLAMLNAGTFSLAGVSNFGLIELAQGTNKVTVTDSTLSPGRAEIIAPANSSNTISAAGDTAASKSKTLIYVGGSGADKFTGGFENDHVYVSAAAIGNDMITGGSGSNALAMRSAGTFSLGGVANFGAVYLYTGTNQVTLTDTTLSGGRVEIIAPANSSNTISAAGDTAASKGKTLIYVSGSGADKFTGGFENDVIYAGTGSGTFQAGSGSATFIFDQSGLQSQSLENFQTAHDDILVYGIHVPEGFDLGSTDNALNPSQPTAIDPSIFIADPGGTFTSASQRFAYDTNTGHLFYSAIGSNSSRSWWPLS